MAPSNMNVELVKTNTSDGLRLDGVLHASKRDASASQLDAMIFLHGVGGNFYGGSMFANITPPFLELGIDVLWANTRGHDGMFATTLGGQYCRQGAAYETVDECRFDINAWTDFLVQRGGQRVGIFGHSLGAIKAIYSQAHEPNPSVQRVVAASPPRLSFSCFQNGERSAEFFETISTAEQHVKEGRENTLIEAKFPFPIVITASGYVDKYGREERYNIVKFAEKVSCPAMFLYGQRELESGGIAFAGVPEALATLSPSSGPFKIATIAGADHSYAGTYGDLSQTIVDWLV